MGEEVVAEDGVEACVAIAEVFGRCGEGSAFDVHEKRMAQFWYAVVVVAEGVEVDAEPAG